MRQQQVNRDKKKPGPLVVDNRTAPPNCPVRTVMYVETGGMSHAQISELAIQFAQSYREPVHGPHYFIPVRGGRIRTDVQFEHEFLATVRQLCEVGADGQIQLKDGATRVQVSRIDVNDDTD